MMAEIECRTKFLIDWIFLIQLSCFSIKINLLMIFKPTPGPTQVAIVMEQYIFRENNTKNY